MVPLGGSKIDADISCKRGSNAGEIEDAQLLAVIHNIRKQQKSGHENRRGRCGFRETAHKERKQKETDPGENAVKLCFSGKKLGGERAKIEQNNDNAPQIIRGTILP